MQILKSLAFVQVLYNQHLEGLLQMLIPEGLVCTKMVQLGRSEVSADSKRLRNSLSRESASRKLG